MSRSGADLALLLLGGFRSLVDGATAELARRGYEDVRPVHDFAMRAIAARHGNASELGRRLSVFQAGSGEDHRGAAGARYVARDTDPRHARRMLLQVTPLGFEVLRQGEAIFDELRDQWERQIGPAQLESLETHLADLAGNPAVRFDTRRLDVARPRRADLDELARPASVVSGDEGSPCPARSAQAMTRPVRIFPGSCTVRRAHHRASPADRTVPSPGDLGGSSRSNAPASDTAPRPSADTVILGWHTVFFTGKVPSARHGQDLRPALSPRP